MKRTIWSRQGPVPNGQNRNSQSYPSPSTLHHHIVRRNRESSPGSSTIHHRPRGIIYLLRAISLIHSLIGAVATASFVNLSLINHFPTESAIGLTFRTFLGGLLGSYLLGIVATAWCDVPNGIFTAIVLHFPRPIALMDYIADAKTAAQDDIEAYFGRPTSGQLNVFVTRTPNIEGWTLVDVCSIVTVLSLFFPSLIAGAPTFFLNLEVKILIGCAIYLVISYFAHPDQYDRYLERRNGPGRSLRHR